MLSRLLGKGLPDTTIILIISTLIHFLEHDFPDSLIPLCFRLLKALGAPKSARIYWAGGSPLGGKDALLPLTAKFPFFYNKEDLALPGELEPFANKASSMAAIDYIVCEKSDVFMASHGGNMNHAIQVLLSTDYLDGNRYK